MTAEIVWKGRFLNMMREGKWEYAARDRDIGAAVILAITPSDEVILVEQYRVPLGRNCLEMPAGLVGDDHAGEGIAPAAIRELEEETGYRAGRVETLGVFHSSPGLTNEGFTLVRAHDLERVGEGGGVDGEDITVHLVPRREVAPFVARKRAEGVAIDVKMLLLLADSLLTGGPM